MTSFLRSTVVVTGGASGIGRLVAERAASRGGEVVIWDLNGDQAAATAEEIGRWSSGPVRSAACDISDAAKVSELAESELAEHGPVDILVNNAGVVSGRSLSELTEAQIRTTFEVNTLALYWTTKAFLPSMVRRNSGHIVTVASAAGLVGVARQTDYSASKHAAVGFDESLRVELARSAPGVRTTVVCPYYVDTGMFEGVRTRWSWLLPILDQDDVADRIASAIERDRAQLIMPPAVRLLPLLRVLPPRIFDRAMDLLGVNVSMDEFVGRSR